MIQPVHEAPVGVKNSSVFRDSLMTSEMHEPKLLLQ